MYINFWYPAEESRNLTSNPIKVRLLGQDFVVFRDSAGSAHCLSNICVHRGAALSEGKVQGDCVECPYHGWWFNGEGVCTRIPSLGLEGKIPARAKVDSYPVQEKYGLVFVFLGDLPSAERPPLLEIEEFGAPGWRSTVQCFEWNINFQRTVENALDPAHNEFVHPTHGFSGANDSYRVPDLDLMESAWGVGFMTTYLAPPLADDKMKTASRRSEDATIQAGSGSHGPASNWTHIHPTDEVFIHQYGFKAPIDEGRIKSYLINMRNFLTEPEHDQRFMDRNIYVANQDGAVLEPLCPVVTPETNMKEILLPADAAIARFRERLKEWEVMGWRIDSDEVRRTQGKVAYAIPSPARRHSKGWTLDPIPLMHGTQTLQTAAQ